VDQFRPGNPFLESVVEEADKELNNLASLLDLRGIKVHRPRLVDWGKVGGYTGTMPRDALLVVGDTIIESCFARKCRRDEVQLAYGNTMDTLQHAKHYNIVRVPLPEEHCDLFRIEESSAEPWQINNSRPAPQLLMLLTLSDAEIS
jgi:N-dimethylarginine dimethylaminohydrolase